MLKMTGLDSPVSLEDQFKDGSNEPVVQMMLITVDAKDEEAFKAAWAKGAAFFKGQPGFISAQLHQGIGGSSVFLDYAVFESVKAFAAITRQPDFGSLSEGYPDSVTASLHLFRRTAIPGICLGEATT